MLSKASDGKKSFPPKTTPPWTPAAIHRKHPAVKSIYTGSDANVK
jgi:hypothetical protein